MARPTKYDSSRNGEVIDLMKEGASIIEVAAMLGVTRDTINKWKDPDSDQFKEEFLYTIKKGVELSQAWWENQGRKNLKNKDFQSALWFMNMKNRFSQEWRDKKEQEVKVDGIKQIVIE